MAEFIFSMNINESRGKTCDLWRRMLYCRIAVGSKFLLTNSRIGGKQLFYSTLTGFSSSWIFVTVQDYIPIQVAYGKLSIDGGSSFTILPHPKG